MKENKVLNGLMFLALDHGVDSVSEGGPLIPFALTKMTGKPNLTRIQVERLEDSRNATIGIVLEKNPKMYAIAYDGYVTIKNKKFDAIIVEAGQRGEKKALKLCQRYVPKKSLRKFTKIGNPAYLGEVDNILSKGIKE